MEILTSKAANGSLGATGSGEGGGSLGAEGAPKMIIGAGTYSRVEAQLESGGSADRPGAEGPSVIGGPSSAVQGPVLPSSMLALRPPPPPPPSFMPHQVRHRSMPPPRPPIPPRNIPGGPPMGMLPPPPPPPPILRFGMQQNSGMGGMMMNGGDYMPPQHQGMFRGYGPPPGPMMLPPPFSMSSPPPSIPSNTIEKPRVVYSAAPSIRRTTGPPPGAPPGTPPGAPPGAPPGSSGAPHKASHGGAKHPPGAPPMGSAPPTKQIAVSPAIQLNVPVSEIESEKRMKAGLPLPPPPPLMGATVAVVHPAGPPGTSGGAQGGGGGKGSKKEKKEKKKKFVRMAAGTVWEDTTLAEWDPDDFRVFCGDLGNEVTDETLARAFNKYPSFRKAKVVRDKRSMKTKGFGFVSFKDPNDFVKAIREMNGKYVGNRPIKLRKSCWQDRQIDVVRKKDKEKKKLGFK